MNFAEKVIAFNGQLEYTGPLLPANIRIMNPYREEEHALQISSTFYRKYYSDNNKRHLILGINPGRFGGGVTGVPFTDPKRLIAECGIGYSGKLTHEPSSVYIYEMINAFGGAKAFYSKIYINSLCPLGFTTIDNKGKEKNYNYYDSKELCTTVTPFMIDNIKKQVALGCYTDTCFCFGTGQNEKFLKKLNEIHGFFNKIVALEHPRFIVQYRSKTRQLYIDKYLQAFADAGIVT
ncbi:SMUG2 DNA glycosylase family protein [Mucilaginibacter sp. 14171R-50]|uniref:uracil-DNA glycosylase family protein n=1 Tax=Mucilaginibacter sp. 14171R-50 TaxID=2703789 RepID=UPI00138C0A09|nr:uracil-DNA glycosylase family protein [Mucilaginibacter sp. 14171R-50]QHS54602.1 SMUG2 DNA glycosylase family protein [Mucilaginibacter sp. 14171R-50]